MSAKDCGHHGESRRRKVTGAVVVTVILALVLIFLVWVILRPTKPTFILQDATVYNFSLSTPPAFLSTTIAITVYCRNPNRRIGIYYDRLEVFATYRGQQVTLPTAIPKAYQDNKEVNIWSPLLYGAAVPVAPYNGVALSQDQAAGIVSLLFKLQGRVRWKVGTFITGNYHLHVSCPAYISLSGKGAAAAVTVDGAALKYQLVQSCSVSV